uniref:LIM domain-containing protein 1 isoform X2 n=1 Tax=Gasterosteus aculeatus aculeatus TaxID=481459 RepID=UPI001A998F4B|nr:LIM domain-containing protein 1 isoform X2 [Gasterosteus aculeatus aculeatus]
MDPGCVSSLYFGSCTSCSEAVYGEGRACRAMGRLFHDTCFTCSVCSEKLSGKPFYTVSGRIYCEEDFLILQARGKSYHPSCFRCVLCRRSLEAEPFTADTDNRVYCVDDYHRVRAPLCAACRVPILPTEGSTESIRVVSFEKNYHAECYAGEVNLI